MPVYGRRRLGGKRNRSQRRRRLRYALCSRFPISGNKFCSAEAGNENLEPDEEVTLFIERLARKLHVCSEGYSLSHVGAWLDLPFRLARSIYPSCDSCGEAACFSRRLVALLSGDLANSLVIAVRTSRLPLSLEVPLVANL